MSRQSILPRGQPSPFAAECYPGSIGGMKLSVSLPASDIAYLDAYATEHSIDSRSAVLQRAVMALRTLALRDDYEHAFAEWTTGDDAEPWSRATGDGLPG